MQPGATVRATLEVSDPEGDAMEVSWVLYEEMKDLITAGDYRPAPPTFPQAIIASDLSGATVKMPEVPGNYRLFAKVNDGRGGGASANLPIQVLAPGVADGVAASAATQSGDDHSTDPEEMSVVKAVLGEGLESMPWIPSGYMGNHAAVTMEEGSTEQAHSGNTSTKVHYAEPGNWAGVVWQHPANNWGDQPGGHDVSGATHLQFYARGKHGGEQIKFGMGLLGQDKAHPDTGGKETTVTLTDDWKLYSIDLSNLDLSSIKTGFYWTLAGQGQPITFYLDDVQYVKAD